MKKTVLMSAAKKARIALAVMALCGMSFVGAQEAFAADAATEHPVKIDAKNNIVCGTGAKAEKATGSTVDPANDIVIGVNAIANDKNSIAIGTGANAKAENSVAIGYGSVADAANTISFGSAFDDSKNKRLVNLAAGTSNNDAATYGQVITSVKQNGNKLEFYTGTNTTTAAMGVELNDPINFDGYNFVGGTGAKIESDSSVWGSTNDNIVIGRYAKASKGYHSGYNCESNPQDNIIIGNSAQAKGVRNIVMGTEATTDGTYGVVLGYKAQSKGEGIAIGAGSKATYGVAIRGTAEGSGALSISDFSVAKGYFATAIGYSAKATGSEAALALGMQSEASEKYTIAIGYYSKATKNGAIAIGRQTEANGEYSTAIRGTASGEYSTAISGTAGGAYSTAVGGTASGEYSTAIGYNSEASGKVSTSIRGTATGEYSFAIGGTASNKYSVSLGNGSIAEDANVVSVGSGKESFDAGWLKPPAYRRIVNMADGTNNHDAATYGQILKKDTYTISLDNTGNGDAVLKTNADKEGPTIKVDASALDTQIKQNASDITAVNGKIGTLSADGTYIKKAKNVSENLVALDNQVKRNADDISIANSTIYNVSSKIGTKYDGNYIHAVNPIGSDLVALDKQVKVNADAIGTLTSLTTTEKTNLVGAVNEVKGTADTALGLANTNKASIGTLTNLATTEKGNLVGAVNEVKGTADAAQTKANDAFTQANTNKASIGTLTNLTTTEKGNLVGAVNEVKGSVDAANTAIAGKADLGLSNINADGKIVIKNLAKTEAGAIVNVQLGDLSTEKYYVDAGKKVNENISALDKQVKTNADAIDLKANQELSNINATGENKIKTIAGVVVEGKLGTLTSSNYVDAANTVNVNISALDVQVKDNADKITTVDNKIGSLSADGKYIKKAKNVSANLVELDKQVNTNATALTNKANLDLSNINAAGKDVIINLAGNKAGEVLDVKLGAITSTHYVNAGNTVNANISALDTQLNKVENKVGTMTDGNYISAGNTVAGNLSALDAQLKNNTDAIADKADKNLSNITDAGKDVIRDLANEKAGELVDSKLGTITSENYVNAGNTVNANISKLDEQVKANADAINTKADKDLSNITDAGKNVIKDLASVKAGEVVDAKLGDITSNNYVNAGNTVNANISALDKQMKVNTDNIGDTGKLTTAGLGSNLSDAVVNVNNKVGTADELKALKDAGLGDNLAQATAAVNKKADKNAEDIKTVNGRVDELGGRVDTLGGAVSKLDTKVNKVGAGAAALAALHPMDFDSDNKLTFAAGVGSYHGASAAAIGAFYRPSEQVMFSISGNMGNGENMVNAGVSFALDRPSKTPTTKAALVKTVAAQNEQIAALSETVAEQNEKIARLEAMVEKLAAKQNA
ncbi:YadA-like family protein [Phascolarctobacterium succinatutens]|uniref:YadA-like family protein n=1 Tax=Phascolarctobacterium succinatutens TaxID=626940 RepID=UPI003AF9BDF9